MHRAKQPYLKRLSASAAGTVSLIKGLDWRNSADAVASLIAGALVTAIVIVFLIGAAA